MSAPFRIAVLVSPARHPLTGKPRRSACDAAALELGLRLAPAQRLTVLCAGMASRESLDDYLGLGAAEIEVLTVGGEADLAPALAARLRGFSLVLCGARADGQSASGLLPYLLAEALELPLVGDVLDAALEGDMLTVRQFLPKGLRRRLELATPAVLALHRRAPQTRQYAYARARAGKVSYLAGGSQAAAPAPGWRVEPAGRRPQPLKARLALGGHERMTAAIGGADAAAGGQLLKHGSADEKAAALLAYLRHHRLIDF
jgi:electron transfer flavoprotein beta subunit